MMALATWSSTYLAMVEFDLADSTYATPTFPTCAERRITDEDVVHCDTVVPVITDINQQDLRNGKRPLYSGCVISRYRYLSSRCEVLARHHGNRYRHVATRWRE